MGLTGAPSYFQREMTTKVLRGLIGSVCEVYLDDIIVYGTTQEEFLNNLAQVLKALERRGVTVNPDKCRLGRLPEERKTQVGRTGISSVRCD